MASTQAVRRPIRAVPDIAPRRYRTGMWSFVLHRITGVAIVLFLLMHIFEVTSVNRGGAAAFDATMKAMERPGLVVGEWLLFLAVTFHGVNGVRLILHDLGWGVRQQKALFWTVMAITAALIIPGSYFFVVKFLAL